MRAGESRGGRQVRVRQHTWRDRGVEVEGAMVDARQGYDRRSMFVPVDQLARVADSLVDVLEAIETGDEQ